MATTTISANGCGMILLCTAERQTTNANPAVAEGSDTACEKVVLNSGQVEEDGARIIRGTDYFGFTEENKKWPAKDRLGPTASTFHN